MSVVGFGVSPGLTAGLGGADPTRFLPGSPRSLTPGHFTRGPTWACPRESWGSSGPLAASSRRGLQAQEAGLWPTFADAHPPLGHT